MKLTEVIGAVEQFHDAFGIPNNYAPTTGLSPEEIELRFNLMREENEEYLEAAQRVTWWKLPMLWETSFIFCAERFSNMACSIKLQRFLKKFSART